VVPGGLLADAQAGDRAKPGDHDTATFGHATPVPSWPAPR
jgi:hypothetical protein